MKICSVCNNEIAPGTRWCGICRTHVQSPEMGRLATPGRRLGAFALDVAIILALYVFVFIVVGVGATTQTNEGVGVALLLGLALLGGYLVWGLVLLARGTSQGKMLLGLRVIAEDGHRPGFFKMLIRELARFVQLAPVFLLGHLWILWDRERQGWHDKLFSTYVVH